MFLCILLLLHYPVKLMPKAPNISKLHFHLRIWQTDIAFKLYILSVQLKKLDHLKEHLKKAFQRSLYHQTTHKKLIKTDISR